MRVFAGILSIFAFEAFLSNINAQDIPGYNMSNYAGVSGVDVQPASIADMRYKWDITVIGAGIDINNNYISAKGKYIRNREVFQKYDGNFQSKYLDENTGPSYKEVGVNAYVQLPSIAYSFSKNISVAFTWRLRSLLDIDNLSPELAHLMFTGLNDQDPENQKYFNSELKNTNFDISQMSWWEYGFDYAQVIKSEGHHFLKAGVRLKLEAGLEAAYIYAAHLDYNWKNNDTLSLYNSSFQQGHTQTLVDDLNGGFNLGKTLTNVSSVTPAMDIGLVYEWRPDYYAWNNQTKETLGNERRDVNKYKLRLGISVLDLGFISFRKGDNAYDFLANKTNWDVNALNFGPNKIHGLDTIIAHTFGSSNTKNTFLFYLPTTLSFQADYHIYNDFYINFTSYSIPHWLNIASEAHTLSYYTITPRWDQKWFGVFLPIGINGYGQPVVGLTGRIGPLIIGTSDGLNLLFANKIYGISAYAALKIPILFKNPFKEGKDNCPKFPVQNADNDGPANTPQ